MSSTDRAYGWKTKLSLLTAGILLFETLSGLAIWLLPFSVSNQWMVLLHTAFGLLFLVPILWYVFRHWLYYRPNTLSHIKVLGYGSMIAIAVIAASGLVLTWQGIFSIRIRYIWDTIHVIATFAVILFVLPHLLLLLLRDRKSERSLYVVEKLYLAKAAGAAVFLLLAALGLSFYFRGASSNHEFPADYSYKYGKDRPFAPSLSRTESGKAIHVKMFSGSESCGTAGCHVEIVDEWKTSAHRYSAMDAGFQAIQLNMAKQNGAESTRYCAGCHDPISLFSGTKNIYTDAKELTNLSGYQEGVSCLVCHSIKKTDVKGNAAYLISEPERYLFEVQYDEGKSEAIRYLRDFLIRAYPRHHVESLSKHLFKAPEYCAACHKQFIDQEINNVGWVQLQNQYDNWRKSRWNHPKNPQKTIECRECHMYLEASRDPSAGDASDYNRNINDGKHRSHRFIAANQFMPAVLKLPGWEKQVDLIQKWLQGGIEIPEIANKWERGPAVSLELIAPEKIRPGEKVDVQAILTSNKVGHDFPTGPLDIIQSWVQLEVKDDFGQVLYTTGEVDGKGFIQAGSFMFKAEPVDQYGNLVDRHNLWEMVGVRHRRALFPGFSDTADFTFFCPDLYRAEATDFLKEPQRHRFEIPIPQTSAGTLTVQASLCYRKVDQFLLNFMFGEKSGITSPVTTMAKVERTITVVP